jgi:hypothetical protein
LLGERALGVLFGGFGDGGGCGGCVAAERIAFRLCRCWSVSRKDQQRRENAENVMLIQ